MPKKEESPEALVQTASKMLASVDELLEGGFLGAQQAKQVQKKHLEKAARTCQRAMCCRASAGCAMETATAALAGGMAS